MSKKGRGFEEISIDELSHCKNIQVAETIDPTIKALHMQLNSGKIILVKVKFIDETGPIGVGTAYFVNEQKEYYERA